MNIKLIPIKDINPAEYNPRIITKEEFNGLVESIKTFGQLENLIVNKDMTLISGHQRLNAMQHLGIPNATCAVVDLNKQQEKKLNVLMNSQAISGKFDDIKLAEILEELKLDDDYESLRLDELEPLDLSPTEIEEDEAPELNETDPPASKLGEIYQLGRHRVMCGDSTKDVDKLFDKATIAFTSPPYNVGHNLGYDNDNKYNEYKDDNPEYLDLLNEFNSIALSKCEYSFVNLQLLAGNKRQVIQWLFENNDKFCDVAFWKKSQVAPAMARNVMNSQVECIFIFGGNGSRAINTGDFKGTVSNFLETNSASGENENAKIHSATYPIAFVSHFINNFTKKGDSVYDAFIGTGSTLIACEQTDRTCYGMELDPKYTDVIRKRWAKFVYPDRWEKEWETLTPVV